MIEKILKQKGSLLIGIDGRCGSGKTTLSEQLADHFEHRTFHMDDYYLPMEQRREDWKEHPCANMDMERFLREVVEPSYEKQTVNYRPYSCRMGTYGNTEEIKWKPLTIVEGSYAHHPMLRPYYDIAIFLTCEKEVQENRLRIREGGRFHFYQELWIPLEEQYFKEFQIEAHADIILDTSNIQKGKLYESIIHF